eukprot:TRINITY_DN5809_c1_g2_i1.p1 TRINITY_DN5809_c1_g2~~TRINITY_DN5809_c1_g2_i1.p1  ORF type:complete len:165 (+),score=39.61 TRINITY_DN5809_c1_g2_i1:87-581(+)
MSKKKRGAVGRRSAKRGYAAKEGFGGTGAASAEGSTIKVRAAIAKKNKAKQKKERKKALLAAEKGEKGSQGTAEVKSSPKLSPKLSPELAPIDPRTKSRKKRARKALPSAVSIAKLLEETPDPRPSLADGVTARGSLMRQKERDKKGKFGAGKKGNVGSGRGVW